MVGRKAFRKGRNQRPAKQSRDPAFENEISLTKSQNACLALHMLPGELLCEDDVVGNKWYDCAPLWPSCDASGWSFPIEDWKNVADQALSAVTRAFERRLGNNAESRHRALNREKTIGDKIASVTLMIQESPVHRLRELYMLLSFAQKKVRHERSPAIDALKDLFINDLLPDHRQILSLQSRRFDVGKQTLSKRHLAYAKFESELKHIFRDFLVVVDECAKDNIVHFKQKSTRVCFDLLVAKPENEKILLAMLVNELGAPERKVASSAVYYLSLLVSKYHPRMKTIVVQEVEQLVHRPNVGLRAKYFALSFLNQLRLSKQDDALLARRLVKIYMDIFTETISRDMQGTGKKSKNDFEAQEGKLVGALLTGVNRSYPFSRPGEDDLDYAQNFESLFKVSHLPSLSSAIQALSFLFQVTRKDSAVSDRFYRALYSRITDVAHAGESKQALFLNLLLKAMRNDVSPKRLKAFAKRLLQAALCGSPGFAAASLLVLSEVMDKNRNCAFKSFILLSENGDDEEQFRDVDSTEKVAEEQSQPSTDHEPRRTPCKEAYYQEEIISNQEGTELRQSNSTASFRSKPSGEETENDLRNSTGKVSKFPSVLGSGYDPVKRDPLHAHAEDSSLWEIAAFSCHYHPSVVSFAGQLCDEARTIEYNGDPLKDFTLGSFLDKFSYRKPKKHVVDSLHGRRSSRNLDNPLVNSEEFLNRGKAGQIQDDEKFYFRFFLTNPEKSASKTGNEANASFMEGENMADEISSAADSEEEAFEKAMREEMRRMGGSGFIDGEPGNNEGDIDSVSEDELQAFQSIFAEEMSDLEAGSTIEATGDLQDASEENDLLLFSDDEERMSGGSRSKGRKENRKRKRDSPFAPVADYTEALENDIADGYLENAKGRNEHMNEGGEKRRTSIGSESSRRKNSRKPINRPRRPRRGSLQQH